VANRTEKNLVIRAFGSGNRVTLALVDISSCRVTSPVHLELVEEGLQISCSPSGKLQLLTGFRLMPDNFAFRFKKYFS